MHRYIVGKSAPALVRFDPSSTAAQNKHLIERGDLRRGGGLALHAFPI
ncbi:MAG: hypothetical protein KJS68_14300 [Alphaproteobacteria bacterium]|nr:hypothetical protein [Alphaproteobacteria bacterium]